MELKKIFLPDLKKIIVALILFLIFPSFMVNLVVIPESPQPTKFIPFFGGLSTLVSILGNASVGISLFSNVNVGFSLFTLILSYVFSCYSLHFFSKKGL